MIRIHFHKLIHSKNYIRAFSDTRLGRMMSQPLSAINGGENVPQPNKMQKVHAEPVLKVKKLSERATLPVRGSAGAAGYDLARCVETSSPAVASCYSSLGSIILMNAFLDCSAEDTVVPAHGKTIVKTDLSIAIPHGTYARVAPRSGLAVKNFIDTGAGVVDEDYRGAVGVVLFNHSDVDFQVKQGDRIAQLILERIMTPEVVEVDSLDETTRGAGGYGSTGV